MLRRKIIFCLLLLSFILLCSLYFYNSKPVDVTAGLDRYNNCGMAGWSVGGKARQLSRLKNRYTTPLLQDIDRDVTLEAILKPGDDRNRWNDKKAAIIIGYIADVKVGGIESANCFAIKQDFRDAHIDIVLDPFKSSKIDYFVAEITPRWRAIMKERGVNWTTQVLRASLPGKRVKITGWLFFDENHAQESENTAPGGRGNFRATAWEIHPVTEIEVLDDVLNIPR
jgi:hypothetical protein